MAVMVVVTLLAHQRPWLGMRLAPSDMGVVLVSARGPAVEIPLGTVITAVENANDRVELTAFDLTTEPDGAMGDYTQYERFLKRQTRLERIQKSERVFFTAVDGTRHEVEPVADGRPLADFPPDFWVQCVVGLVAWLVSAAVFAFRPHEPAARYLLLSGVATLIFAPAAAVYTTRELAVDGTLLRWASDLNFFGGSLFAASFVALLLVYPRRIAPRWVGIAVVVLYVVWFVLQQVGVFESMTFARRFLVMVGVATTFVLAAVHWRGTGRDPLGRAALQWFLLSWVVGTGVFTIFILLPQTFGVDTSPIQGYAFLLFLLVYGGLAFGILRYRLFDLGLWWRRALSWAVMVLLLVLFDMLFLYGLHLTVSASLSLALLVCGVFWIPARGFLWNRFIARRADRTADLLDKTTAVALTPADDHGRAKRWQELMQLLFAPLEISICDGAAVTAVQIEQDGLVMRIPAADGLPGLRLAYAHGGRSLFRPDDAALATELIFMTGHLLDSLAAYHKGVNEERSRMARDMHDNIGAQLLAALHSCEPATKDARIREALADLRECVNHPATGTASLDEMLANLRMETAERLEAVGMTLRWESPMDDPAGLARTTVHALRSIIREAVSNAIRHANAREMSIHIRNQNSELTLEIDDDGCGFDPDTHHDGNGLINLRERLKSVGGSHEIRSNGDGTRIAVRIPIDHPGFESLLI